MTRENRVKLQEAISEGGLEEFAGHLATCSMCARSFENDEMPDTDADSFCAIGILAWNGGAK